MSLKNTNKSRLLKKKQTPLPEIVSLKSDTDKDINTTIIENEELHGTVHSIKDTQDILDTRVRESKNYTNITSGTILEYSENTSQFSLNENQLSLNCISLSQEMAALIKASSLEFNTNIENNFNKYGREIDIYAIIGSNDDKKNDNDDNNEDEGDMDIYDYIDEYRDNYEPVVKITPLSISVQSAKAKMTTVFDLHILATVISKSIIKNINKGKNTKFSILGVFYKDIHEGIIKKPKPRKKGAFPNNMAIIVKSPMGTGKVIHMKIFTGEITSSISMVGCKIKEDGIAVIKILEQYILKQSILFTEHSIQTKKEFKINGFETTMVNSNYSIGFKVDRDRLFNHLCKKYSYLFVSYDPAVYAAVKIGYYYNSIKDIQNGICNCPNNTCTLNKSTSGKGSGNGIGQCKKITIAIFESGNVVITGGRNINHANSAYNYINILITNDSKYFASINLLDIC